MTALRLGSFGALSILVEADRVRDGIPDVFTLLTLAERANEAFMGVVTALGNFDSMRSFAGVFWTLSFVSHELGRAVVASPPNPRFTRFPGDS